MNHQESAHSPSCFLLRGFVKPLTNERTENTNKALVITMGLCFRQTLGGVFSQL